MDSSTHAERPPFVETAVARALQPGRLGQSPVWDVLRSTAQGGSRLRPRVLLAAYDDLGGPSPREVRAVAERVAGAIELLHTAFLAHDDVIDDDHIRHGRPNVAGTYAATALRAGTSAKDAHAYGAAAGILAGDLALATAFREVALCGAHASVTAALLDLFDRTMHVTADGELSDVWLGLDRPGDDADLAVVLAAAERKTAAYTFELPLRAAALLAGSQDLEVSLSLLGRALGLAFQLRDDLVGTFGDPAVTGKSASSDLREGKRTALVMLARGTPAWERIAGVLGRPDAPKCRLLAGWPGALSAALVVPYIASIATYRHLADADSDRAHAGWRTFLWLNLLTGFLVTQLLIWIALGR
ncbi:polyprenyl synthetase family protein [Xylanimonas sp. McL0601]|uniref:polyprenyl synthetase family protein n=1 Tax=Xylanimonas sp. McL0601 TaxID=3414739 RepID=UPI003CE7408C